MNPRPIPAAQYLRMSTEHQQYSMSSQAASIQEYAKTHGFEIIQTYSDAGRSGLVLRRRVGLQTLLADVVAGQHAYQAILVYDVSRWGRFQDNDEAAHYEFLCKQAGVPVHYCAEPFPNDGTLPSSLLKALKRSMAAEFSRELGVKIYHGKQRLAQMGFRVGGRAGLGLRRLVLSAKGEARQMLAKGEFKGIATDRTILVPGPDEEVRQVRQIFELALTHSPNQIATLLNSRGVTSDNRKPWSYATVQYLLTNPKYVGCNVWGRTSVRLRGRRLHLPREQWIQQEQAFRPIIGTQLFNSVQAKLAARDYPRTARYDNEELLQLLKAILASCGKLSQRLITAHGGPSNATLRWHFGSSQRAYARAGFQPPRQVWKRLRQRRGHAKLLAELQRKLVNTCREHLRASALFRRQTILVDGLHHVPIIVCRGFHTQRGELRWQLRSPRKGRELLTLLCLLQPGGEALHSMCLLPGINKPGTYRIRGENDPWFRCGRRLRSFSDFYRLALGYFLNS